jgi:hypothetical protein
VTQDRTHNLSHTHDQWFPYLFGFLRGIVFGLAGGLLDGPLFGLVFGFLSGICLIVVYAFQLSPTDAYQPHVKPRLWVHELIASAMHGDFKGRQHPCL